MVALTPRKAGRERAARRRLHWPRCLLCLLLVLALFIGWSLWEGRAEEALAGMVYEEDGERIFFPKSAPSLVTCALDSTNAILLDRQSQQVWFSLAAAERIYPASLTKIATAICALELIDDLSSSYVVPAEIYPALYEAHASLAGLNPGEEVCAYDLLAGTLLPSGADAAACLARLAAGSEEAFVAEMNALALRLGLNDTHFVNTSGLHDPGHYSTVADLARLLCYALENPTFRSLFCLSSYTWQPLNGGAERTWRSTLFAWAERTDFVGGEVLGGKTGYTSEAGLCLASYARKNGREYVLVTAHAPGKPTQKPLHIEDALRVYESYIRW